MKSESGGGLCSFAVQDRVFRTGIILLIFAGLFGCEPVASPPATEGPVAIPPPPSPLPRKPAPPVVEHAPEMAHVLPETPPSTEPPPLPELPPAVRGHGVEQEIEGVYFRLIDAYRTCWGLTAIIVAVNREDRSRSFSIASGTIYGTGESKVSSESAKICPRDESSILHFELGFNQPVTFSMSWAGLQWEQATLLRLDSTGVGRQIEFSDITFQEPFTRPVPEDVRVATLARLQKFFEEARTAEACWGYDGQRGSFELHLRWWIPESSSFDGWAVDSQQIQLKKAIKGEFIPEGDQGLPAITLEANAGSGHESPPTRTISTMNLLRKGQALSIGLSMYYTELVGTTDRGVQIAIRIPPI